MTDSVNVSSAALPLIPFPPACAVGRFLRRHKRFSVAVQLEGEEIWIHSNNSGSMLGLVREGLPVMLSPAANPARKLPFTQECVWLPAVPSQEGKGMTPCVASPEYYDHWAQGFWVGVNTSVPNKLLEAAFKVGRLDFARGYTRFQRESKRGASRLDACLQGEGLPALWVECKNVTMVEDNVACFPDAASERGQKHLRELMDIVRSGERAVMFYLVQRADGHCFGPADVVDPVYAALFWEAVDVGVEMRPYRASISAAGIDLGPPLPLATRP